VERSPVVSIFGEPFRLRAEVAVLNELSAHADQQELLKWVRPIASKLKKVFLVHGERSAQRPLASRLIDELNLKVFCPSRGDSVVLD
jgi:metallo-beta-lactamase family protein